MSYTRWSRDNKRWYIFDSAIHPDIKLLDPRQRLPVLAVYPVEKANDENPMSFFTLTEIRKNPVAAVDKILALQSARPGDREVVERCVREFLADYPPGQTRRR